MARNTIRYLCQACSYESPKWMGKCPHCQEWNTMSEVLNQSAKRAVQGDRLSQAVKLTEIPRLSVSKWDTRMQELNRVLGGGLVPGSLVLVGGDPGIGKSTLLLQLSHALAHAGHPVLYVSGEESLQQTSLRAERLGASADSLYVMSETELPLVFQAAEQSSPALLVVDSIQTLYHPELSSTPGSVSQVRECTGQLMRFAKQSNTSVMIVGHVTKQGDIAGPRLLEHMVDTVLYFEGERHQSYRILRSVKNRFGSTHELGIFEMGEWGLREVLNPSELFLSQRTNGVPGSTVVASMEGTRPVLVELQALVSPTSFATPRRMVTGLDYNRVALLMAVLEKRVGMMLQNQDAYVNAVGGVRLDEPATDLAVAAALASSFRNRPISPRDVVFGEVGLTGEVRGVSRVEQRIREAAKLGFERAIIPQKNIRGLEAAGLQIAGVETLQEALQLLL